MSYEDDFVVGDGTVEVPVQETPVSDAPTKSANPQSQTSTAGLPDPNVQVEKPVAPKKNYNGMANGSKKATKAKTEKPSTMKAVPKQEHAQMHQVKTQTETPVHGQVTTTEPAKKKKFPMIPVILGVVIVGIIVIFALKGKGEPEVPPLVAQPQTDYNLSGRFVVDQLQNALNTFDATKIDELVGVELGDSYIAQEWAYVNRDLRRQEFISKVGQVVVFSYPKVPQLSTTGVEMKDETGATIMIDSMLNNGETIQVTIPDYQKMTMTMEEDKIYIEKLFKSSGYSEDDYEWYDNMANLMLQYICEKPSIPTRTVDITFSIGLNLQGTPYIKDDIELDKLLFSSDDFHTMCAKFSQLCLGWTGNKAEKYVVQEEQRNPEYDEWNVLFQKYYAEDDGKFSVKNSKWEPWYLRDENNQFVLDENGEKIVNYYSIKAADGTDWIQPAETILVDVVKTRQIPDPWVEETGILYNWIGQYYIKYEYDGIGDTVIRVGDGSKDRPAGIGTPIITKVKDNRGRYRDVRVSLVGYWTGKDAIDYAERFSSRNRGFTTASVIQLITFEIKIENLEDKPITFSSEMTLCDANSNISSRTGTIYGFTEEMTLGAGETVIINDWATSTELAQKYVCWGKSFGREYSMVYFDVLAGTGDIPTYSAYKAFTGESSME